MYNLITAECYEVVQGSSGFFLLAGPGRMIRIIARSTVPDDTTNGYQFVDYIIACRRPGLALIPLTLLIFFKPILVRGGRPGCHGRPHLGGPMASGAGFSVHRRVGPVTKRSHLNPGGDLLRVQLSVPIK